MRVTFTVNGRRHEADDVWEGESLLYVLRERMGLPGSKNACEQGECGSCTVRLDGESVCACLVAAGQVEGRDVVTVEGLADYARMRTEAASAPAADPSSSSSGPSSVPGPTSAADEQRWQAMPPSEAGVRLSPVQQAFIDAGAVQCGFCTPGLLVAADELIEHNARPSDADIREALSGNLCRCTGYEKILDAVRLAAARTDHAEGADRGPGTGPAQGEVV
ncbi:(2Fe-2S)-binding protein [Streptomyces sp. WMMB 322]|uniref:(2Fe-2S)-binding protein n=1 Tax=Streptomyces sp. WMMB 322 TaxID=1286821 RepID=UPI0006E20884|nr:(2Fe-2S)-binding protein [Streptomyces sp. WMMB 322]SCK42719.1 carbon-monoxide dehydrogenase small subunit [Streptomyces sp. WMMB 322]